VRKYSPYFPFRVHRVHGVPVIYNQADKPVDYHSARDAMRKAFHTMQTHFSRTFHLAEAQSTAVRSAWDNETFNMREYAFEEVDRELERVEEWCAAMRRAVDEEMDKAGLRERVRKLRAKAESTTFEGESRVFHAKADELEGRT
jgi:hypothetical protein